MTFVHVLLDAKQQSRAFRMRSRDASQPTRFVRFQSWMSDDLVITLLRPLVDDYSAYNS